MGHKNIKFSPNKYELSLPITYWMRLISEDAFVPKANNLNYGFSCLNNRPSIDRLILGYNFYINDLLDSIIFSQNLFDEALPFQKISEDFSFDRFDDYKKLLPIRTSNEANLPRGISFRGDDKSNFLTQIGRAHV